MKRFTASIDPFILGGFVGGLVALSDLPLFSDPRVLLALGLGETAVVYLIYLRCYSRGKWPSQPAAPRPALLTSR